MQNIKGVLVIAHGSRNLEAQEDFKAFFKSIKNRFSDMKIEPAAMEFDKPCISESIKKLYNEGVREIIAVPFLLLHGNHFHHDIPEEIEKEKQKYEGLKVIMTNLLFPDERLVDIVTDRINEGLQK